MLAATSTQSRDSLELVRLALLMISTGNQNISEPLKTYCGQVMAQAREVVDNPSRIDAGILPEAIDLALEIRESEGLTAEMGRFTSMDNVTPVLAKEILTNMEAHSVHKD